MILLGRGEGKYDRLPRGAIHGRCKPVQRRSPRVYIHVVS
jgi:hypothetical protein